MTWTSVYSFEIIASQHLGIASYCTKELLARLPSLNRREVTKQLLDFNWKIYTDRNIFDDSYQLVIQFPDFLKALLISVLPEREIREMWESFYQCTGALAAPAAPVPPPLTCNRPQISIMVPYICLTSSAKWRKRTLLKLESQL